MVEGTIDDKPYVHEKPPPIKCVPSVNKTWLLAYESELPASYDMTHDTLDSARKEVGALRDIGIEGPITIYEAVEVYKSRPK